MGALHRRHGSGRVGTEERDLVPGGAHRLALAEAQQVSAHVVGRLVTLVGRLGQSFHHDGLEIARNLAVELRGRRHRIVHVLARDLDGRVADEWRTAGEHLVEHHAQ